MIFTVRFVISATILNIEKQKIFHELLKLLKFQGISQLN